MFGRKNKNTPHPQQEPSTPVPVHSAPAVPSRGLSKDPTQTKLDFPYYLTELHASTQELGNRLWWWHWLYGTGKYNVRLTTQLLDYFSWAMPMIYERSAFFYELEARLVGNYRFGQSWPYLSQQEKEDLCLIWPLGQESRHLIAKNCAPDKIPFGWTPPHNLSFNLYAPDKSLVRAFLGMIHKEREQHRIPTPREEDYSAAKANWNAIELLDTQLFGIRHLTPFEQSEIDQAREEYARHMKENSEDVR